MRAPVEGSSVYAAGVFEQFERGRIRTSGAEITYLRGGRGPPVLLLHGFPQTHVMWHRVAPALARRFTVVCTDLRGHGDSSKPGGGPEHRNYSKAVMAADQVEVMQTLGFDRFHLVGHDRGARVAHRLALDHPGRVTRLALLDIVPTTVVMEQLTRETAMSVYHWFFLVQPYDLPERLILADPSFYLRWHLRSWSGGNDVSFVSDDAMDAYERAFGDPRAIHTTTEDIRALMSIDYEAELADRGKRKFACPLLVVWGARGKSIDVAAAWREWATDIRGRALDCGHFLAEERPSETAAELDDFLTE